MLLYLKLFIVCFFIWCSRNILIIFLSAVTNDIALKKTFSVLLTPIVTIIFHNKKMMHFYHLERNWELLIALGYYTSASQRFSQTLSKGNKIRPNSDYDLYITQIVCLVNGFNPLKPLRNPCSQNLGKAYFRVVI